MTNVVLLNNVFPPVKSGSSNFVATCAKKLRGRGHNVVVITSKFPGTNAEEDIDGVKVYRLPCFKFPELEITLKYSYITITATPMNVYRVWRILKKHKIEFIQVHGQIFDLSIVGVIMKKILRLPASIFIHTYVMHKNKFYGGILRFFDKTFARLIVSGYDFVPVGDKYTKDYVDSTYKVEPFFSTGIINPIDIPHVEPKSFEYKTILSVGHLHKIRDGTVLIKAMPKILEHYPDVKLLFVGDVYSQEPIKLVDKLKLQDSVLFMGSKTHTETLGYTAGADIHVCGLELGFAIGKSSFEAMALGKPVISAVSEDYFGDGLLKNNENIVLIEKNNPDMFADAAIKLLSDASLRGKIGENAQRFMHDNITWDNTCMALERMYNHSER